MAGVGKPFENSCILTACAVTAILTNTCIITKYGRRRVFLITGLMICAVTQLIIAVVYTIQPTSPAALRTLVALTVLYIVSYNVSLPH